MRKNYQQKVNIIKLGHLRFVVGRFFEVCEFIISRVAQEKPTVYLPCSLYDFASMYNNERAISHYKSIDFCTTDGMPLVWFVRILGYRHAERVYGPHLMGALLSELPTTIQHVFLTPTKAVKEQLVMVLVKRFPTINKPNVLIVPKDHTTFEPTKQLTFISTKNPRVVFWIGIGSPNQVSLAKRLRSHFPKATIFCVGASFEFLTGAKPFAPHWMQYLGLEWLFRLMVEPRRLYKRYLFVIPRFLLHEVLTRLRGYFPF